MDCDKCDDKTKVRRGCPLPLENPKSEALKPPTWVPVEEGPRACARLVADRDVELWTWMRGYNRLEHYGAYPHSPGDWGAQGARWSEAVELIRAVNADLDREDREEAKKKAEAKKGTKGSGRR